MIADTEQFGATSITLVNCVLLFCNIKYYDDTEEILRQKHEQKQHALLTTM